MFYIDKIDDKKILKSDLIQNAFFTTRESFIKTKDEKLFDTVEKNRQSIMKYFKVNKIIMPSQRHTANIEIAKYNKDNYDETDALILKDKEFLVALNFADCTPVVLYDEKLKIGSIAHAGWRGTVQKISQKTVYKMIELGSNPKDIKALIGPCISKKHFETGDDVKEALYNSIAQNPPKDNPDLKYINKIQLEKTGVEKIDICPYCTVDDNDLFFHTEKTAPQHPVIAQF